VKILNEEFFETARSHGKTHDLVNLLNDLNRAKRWNIWNVWNKSLGRRRALSVKVVQRETVAA